uniref:Uncharacterized protein n=1 Tax=Anopheles atroparvus TaxID=41427 RepID=A0AAG5CX33_ANOAO
MVRSQSIRPLTGASSTFTVTAATSNVSFLIMPSRLNIFCSILVNRSTSRAAVGSRFRSSCSAADCPETIRKVIQMEANRSFLECMTIAAIQLFPTETVPCNSSLRMMSFCKPQQQAECNSFECTLADLY